jgi:ABC-type nickel/cobalt efflux system permease component RcnA
LLLLTALVLAAGGFDVLAQTSPFGVGRTVAPPAPDGLVGWVLAKQAEFYRGLSATIRAAKADGTAVYGLFGLAFAYGVFHAAGPGHGKAVITSYVVANEETWRRGVTLSFASALLQAIVAIAIVAIAAALLGATARTMNEAVRAIEIASYLLIAAIGARLLWVKGRGFVAALNGWLRPPVAAPAGQAGAPVHFHDHNERGHARHSGGHDHDHADGDHVHGPEPVALAGPGGWRRGLAAVVAVGLRPCSGAILVLVFALAQGLFWAGVGATLIMALGTAITVAVIATLAVSAKGLAGKFAQARPGAGTLVLRGIEVGAAALILVFGLLLLFGYMSAERLMGV